MATIPKVDSRELARTVVTSDIPANHLIRPRMPELDAVRGVAILLVVFFHGFGGMSQGMSGVAKLFTLATSIGWTGVNLFFVLSGFLITGILLDSKNSPRYYQNFYIRRALRILPAYYLLLVVLWLLPRLGLTDNRRISFAFIGLSFVYLSNVTNFFGVTMQYGPLWSLAVEEHFYLVWPTAVRRFFGKNLAYLALAVVVACPLFRAIAYEMHWSYGNGYTWLVADGLAAGAFLAVICRTPGVSRKHILKGSLVCTGFAVALLCVGLPFGVLRSATLLGGGSLRLTVLNFFFVSTLAVVLLIGTSRWRGIVQRPALQFFGEISYGLYLIHMLAFDVFDHFAARYFPSLSESAVHGHFAMIGIRFLLAAGAAVLIAFVSRRTFEESFLKLKTRWTPTNNKTARLQPLPIELNR